MDVDDVGVVRDVLAVSIAVAIGDGIDRTTQL